MGSFIDMAEARSERLRHRSASRAQAEPSVRRQALDDDDEGSSYRPSGRTEPSLSYSATISSHVRSGGQPAPGAALLMAQELLRYRPTDAGHDGWLARVTELVNAAGAAPAPSRSMAPPPSRAPHAGSIAHGAPPPPPPPGGDVGRNRDTRVPGGAPLSSHGASSPRPEAPSCQIIQRAPEDARVALERQRERRAHVL